MNNKILLTLLMGIFLSLNFVLAFDGSCLEDPGIVNNNMTLLQTCSDCSYVNLSSVQYPDGTNRNFNVEMTQNDISFTYNFTDTSQIGTYYYTVKGDKGGVTSVETICFEVTPNGFTGNLGFYILIVTLVIGLIILGYSVQDYNLIILGSFGLVLFGLYILFYGLAGMKDTVYTWGIGIIILMVGAYFGTRASMEQLQ